MDERGGPGCPHRPDIRVSFGSSSIAIRGGCRIVLRPRCCGETLRPSPSAYLPCSLSCSLSHSSLSWQPVCSTVELGHAATPHHITPHHTTGCKSPHQVNVHTAYAHIRTRSLCLPILVHISRLQCYTEMIKLVVSCIGKDLPNPSLSISVLACSRSVLSSLPVHGIRKLIAPLGVWQPQYFPCKKGVRGLLRANS
jgi:hypothetical protein